LVVVLTPSTNTVNSFGGGTVNGSRRNTTFSVMRTWSRLFVSRLQSEMQNSERLVLTVNNN
jgi:hypothetical protein